MRAGRDALLRTFASVPPDARVLNLGTPHAADLARLGFDVWGAAPDPEASRQSVADVLGEEEAARRIIAARPDALGFPDEFFDWAAVALGTEEGASVLQEIRRVLRPGAWVWVLSDGLAPEALAALAEAADLAIAESPRAEGAGSRAIFRRVGQGVGA